MWSKLFNFVRTSIEVSLQPITVMSLLPPLHVIDDLCGAADE